MSRCNDDSIKFFRPPLILLSVLQRLSKSENLFSTVLVLMYQLNSRVISNPILIPIPIQQILNIPFDGLPMPERRVFSMSLDIQF